MAFECGVAKYVFAKVDATIHFPVDYNGVVYAMCDYCSLYHKSMNQCFLTKEYIVEPKRKVGFECPLRYEEVEGDAGAEKYENL